MIFCKGGLCLQQGCMSVEIIKESLNILPLWLKCPGSGPCHLKGHLSCVELLRMILQTWATKQLLLASTWPCFVLSKHCANFFFLLFEMVYRIQVLIIWQSLVAHQNFTDFTGWGTGGSAYIKETFNFSFRDVFMLLWVYAARVLCFALTRSEIDFYFFLAFFTCVSA